MAYDPAKAEAFNKARAQGLTYQQAARAAGLTAGEIQNYSVGSNGQMGPSSQVIAGPTDSQGRPVEVLSGDAAARARAEEAAFYNTGLPRTTPYDQTANTTPGLIRTTNYTETSTTSISGGGSTTIVATPSKATPASQALDAQAQQTQREIEALQLANSGLGPGPQLTEEQMQANDAKILQLQQQYNTQRDAAESAKIPSPPSITTVPNTTTNVSTVVYERSTEVTPVNASDPSQTARTTESGVITRSASTVSTAPAFVDPAVPTVKQASSVGPVPTGAGVSELSKDASIVRATNPDLPPGAKENLDAINDANAKIVEAQGNIQTNNLNILRAEEQIADARQTQRQAQTIIEANNAELADPSISDERRAELLANNAEQAESIAETAQYIDDASQQIENIEANTALQQQSIADSQFIADYNAAAFKANGGGDLEVDTALYPELQVEPEQDEEVIVDTTGPGAVDANQDQALSDEEILARQNAGGLSDEEILARQQPVNPGTDPGIGGTAYDDDGNLNPGWTLDENNNPVFVGGGFVEPATAESAAASREAAVKAQAKKQATVQARYKQPGNKDWRVRLSLGPGAQYLYNATPAGVLAPLAANGGTDGVIFPYTPQISTTYTANYEQYDLIHSNYRGLFYKNSRVGDIQIRGTFTAQDTTEANYLLAVIHFFRSVTKMFYGQDTDLRGTPPPICLLNGFGGYQFSDHPVVVSAFNYTLPNDVDYIRTTNPNNFGLNLNNRYNPNGVSLPAGGALAGLNRLLNAIPGGLSKGALPKTPAPNTVVGSVTNNVPASYVPTKMEIDVTLIPVQTRSQVSQQFSLKGFANGDLLKGGFW